MDVERHPLEMLLQSFEVALVHGTDRVRGNAEACINACIFCSLFSQLRQLDIALEIIAEAQLPACKRPSIDAALRIGDGQQCQADAGGACRRSDPLRQFAEMVIGLAAWLMVHIVKFGNAGIAKLQHLDKGKGGDRLDVLGTQYVEKAVHDFAPRPETVAPGRAACFGKPRHGPLERVAVQIRLCGEQNIDRVCI